MKKKETTTMQYILFGIAFLLLLFATVETTQINALQEGSLTVVSAQATPTTGQSAPAPAPVRAPTMVGGC